MNSYDEDSSQGPADCRCPCPAASPCRGGVSTLAPFKDPRLDQGTGTTLEGVEEDEVQQSAVLKDIPGAYAFKHEEADREHHRASQSISLS